MVMNAFSSICRLYSAENQLIWCKIAIFDKIRSKMMENCVFERMAKGECFAPTEADAHVSA